MFKIILVLIIIIFLTKTTAAQSEDALSYDRMRGLYFLAVVFTATIGSPVPLEFVRLYL